MNRLSLFLWMVVVLLFATVVRAEDNGREAVGCVLGGCAAGSGETATDTASKINIYECNPVGSSCQRHSEIRKQQLPLVQGAISDIRPSAVATVSAIDKIAECKVRITALVSESLGRNKLATDFPISYSGRVVTLPLKGKKPGSGSALEAWNDAVKFGDAYGLQEDLLKTQEGALKLIALHYLTTTYLPYCLIARNLSEIALPANMAKGKLATDSNSLVQAVQKKIKKPTDYSNLILAMQLPYEEALSRLAIYSRTKASDLAKITQPVLEAQTKSQPAPKVSDYSGQFYEALLIAQVGEWVLSGVVDILGWVDTSYTKILDQKASKRNVVSFALNFSIQYDKAIGLPTYQTEFSYDER